MSHLGGSQSPVEDVLDRRIISAALLIVAFWIVLISRLFYLQVLQADRYGISAQRNSVRTYRVEADRGIIKDRNGEILVDSRPSFDVMVVADQTDELPATLRRVAVLTGENPDEVIERFGRPSGRRRFLTLPVVTDLDRSAYARVEVRLPWLTGVIPQASRVRFYPHGESAAHLLGTLGEISQKELTDRTYQGYRQGDVIGKEGIERLWDRELRGQTGGRNVVVDAHGREFETLSEVEPKPGSNVVLTLDYRLQRVAEEGLAETGKSGAVVAIDPRNGEVLVFASRPAYDPNLFARGGVDSVTWRGLRDDPKKPLHNRALQGQFPPGSVYKVVPALAGLERGIITEDFTVNCTGGYSLGRRRYRCWKKEGHGVVNVHKALVQSCDVFFYRVGDILEVDVLAHYAKALGLGSPTGIGLRDESRGLVPTRAWKERRFNQRWLEGETISLAIGQGFNLWTPIQMANAYASLANGGTRYRPHVIKRVEDPYGEIVTETEPEVLGQVEISKASLEIVKQGLWGVANEPRGTAYRLHQLPGGVQAAGKTGTAQVVGMPKDPVDEKDIPEEFMDHAWFAAYAPHDNPEIAIAVLVEHGGHGGSAAAPIAKKVFETYFAGRVPPPPVPPAQEAKLSAGN